MLINIKRKTVNIIIAIVIIAIIIGVGIFIANIVITNVKIKDVEQKLSAINSEELQGKIEEELRNTDLFVEMDLDMDVDNLYVASMINEGVEFEGYTCVSTLCFKGDFDNIIGIVETPCFKITSDENGNFINIEYTEVLFNETREIEKVVERVFEKEYGIDLKKLNENKKTRKKFYKEATNEYTHKGEVYTMDDNFFIAILHNITGIELEYNDNVIEDMKEYKTKTFGLEF